MIVVGNADIVELITEAVPGVSVTVAVFAMRSRAGVLPPKVFSEPLIIADPEDVTEVRVAVHVPLFLSETDPRAPNVVVSVNQPPLYVRLAPLASLACIVTVDVV